jgi:glycosyltransferase involved in cell wall biosynthesis
MTPRLSLLVPTAGRLSLRRTIDSVADQVLPGDELLVIGDVLDGPLPQTEAICAGYPFVRYLPFKGEQHDHGHSCMNHGIEQVRGDWIVANDDDDVWTSGALAAMREAIEQLRRATAAAVPLPVLLGADFMVTPEQRAAGVVQEGTIGGHCLVAPRAGMGRRTSRGPGTTTTEIAATINNYGGRVGWVDHVIAIARPA